jgi:hypothetical protein
MHADQFQILPAKEQLQKAVLVADDPATRIFLVTCPPDDVSDALSFQWNTIPLR